MCVDVGGGIRSSVSAAVDVVVVVAAVNVCSRQRVKLLGHLYIAPRYVCGCVELWLGIGSWWMSPSERRLGRLGF